MQNTKNNKKSYVSAARIREIAEIHSSTLRGWAENGKLSCIRMPGGERLYDREQFEQLFFGEQQQQRQRPRACLIYARVSSQHQKEDLERQIIDLQQTYPNHEVVKDNVRRHPGLPYLPSTMLRNFSELLLLRM